MPRSKRQADNAVNGSTNENNRKRKAQALLNGSDYSG